MHIFPLCLRHKTVHWKLIFCLLPIPQRSHTGAMAMGMQCAILWPNTKKTVNMELLPNAFKLLALGGIHIVPNAPMRRVCVSMSSQMTLPTTLMPSADGLFKFGCFGQFSGVIAVKIHVCGPRSIWVLGLKIKTCGLMAKACKARTARNRQLKPAAN